jgi:hypothetical protein
VYGNGYSLLSLSLSLSLSRARARSLALSLLRLDPHLGPRSGV